MAKFGINDIMGIKNMETQTEAVREYQEIWLSPYDVKPSESNFYSQEKIEELADSFLAVGQQQPTVLARVDGEFRIVSGHRRNLANIRNLERGHKEYQRVRYLYKDMSPAMLELSLVVGNAYNRELTAWERTQQAQKLKEALIRARDEEGLEIPGKLRDVIAGIMKESSSGIARMDSIHKNAGPEVQEEFRKGNLGISAAYEAAKLPPEEQKEIARQASLEGGMKAKEVAERTVNNKERRDRKDRKDMPLSEVSKLDTEPTKASQKDEKRKSFKKESRHKGILREWGAERGSMTAVTRAVTEAVRRVSKLDTDKLDWSDLEWTVFLTGEIRNLADCISEEDLYLLHDIMIRCKEKQRDT